MRWLLKGTGLRAWLVTCLFGLVCLVESVQRRVVSEDVPAVVTYGSESITLLVWRVTSPSCFRCLLSCRSPSTGVQASADLLQPRGNGPGPGQHTRGMTVAVTWCFTPSQPLRLYQAEGDDGQQTTEDSGPAGGPSTDLTPGH